jgi:hypothetical protein
MPSDHGELIGLVRGTKPMSRAKRRVSQADRRTKAMLERWPIRSDVLGGDAADGSNVPMALRSQQPREGDAPSRHCRKRSPARQSTIECCAGLLPRDPYSAVPPGCRCRAEVVRALS